MFEIGNRRYLGSKAKLLNFIHETIEKECGHFDSFLDLFAGTGNVGWSFNDDKTKVIVNDLLVSNYFSYLSFFGKQKINNRKIKQIINEYNKVNETTENYFSKNFSNTYFSNANCIKIGFIREDIEKKFISGAINEREKAILITSLIYAMDRIANTVGHYDAFRLNGDLNQKLILDELSIPKSSINKNNEVYNLDANFLVQKIKADIVYIDPPYNSRQYCDAYHLLENVAIWNKPQVYGVAKKMDRSTLKSKYCSKTAPLVFDQLIKNINAKYIVVSYNNTGTKGAGRSQAKISDEDIISSLEKKGSVKVFETDHNQFTTGKSVFNNHKERLFVCKVGDFSNNKMQKNEIKEGFAKSPLNYTGGKFKLLAQLNAKFPKNISTFIDMFGGGFNVGSNISADLIVYNDKNKKLTRLIKLFYKYQGSNIIDKIDKISFEFNLSNSYVNGYEYYSCTSDKGLGRYNKEGYLKLRNKYNHMTIDNEEKDFLLLTLIVYCFNNQIRFNDNGHFNMPVGKRDLNNSMRNNIKNFSSKLKGKKIIFMSKDFNKINLSNFNAPFVYCDPPYYLGTASYNENDGWTEEDEIKLLSFLEKLNEQGIPFALSNVIQHKGLIHEILQNWINKNFFNTTYIKSNYSNSNYHLKDKINNTVEVLITNY